MAETQKQKAPPAAKSRPFDAPPLRALDVPRADNEKVKAAGAKWNADAKTWHAPAGSNWEVLSEWAVIPLFVPYKEKDLAKAAGARWNPDMKCWYGPRDGEAEQLERWTVVLLDVPYAEKDLAKAAGARWDGEAKRWFAPASVEPEKLDRWRFGTPREQRPIDLTHVLDVPFNDKDAARAGGAWWDPGTKLWLARDTANVEKLQKWVPTPARAEEIFNKAREKVALARREAQRLVLDVPHNQRSLAKEAGARFDGNKKLWYVEHDSDLEKVKNWIPTAERRDELIEEANAKIDFEKRQANRIVLDVPYSERDEAKALGAWWDGTKKLWYIDGDAELAKLKAAWIPSAERKEELLRDAAAKVLEEERLAKRVVLDVQYNERDAAKLAGARFDGTKKLWYIDGDADLEKLKPWIPTAERKSEILQDAAAKVEQERRLAKRIILDVSYKQRQLAKDAGARFDGTKKLWYVEGDADLEKVKPWIPTPERKAELLAPPAQHHHEGGAEKAQAQDVASAVAGAREHVDGMESKSPERPEPIRLHIPYAEKEMAKAAGAIWDKEQQAWFVSADADREKLARWVPEPGKTIEVSCVTLNKLGVRTETLTALPFTNTWFHSADGEAVLFQHRGVVLPNAAPVREEVASSNIALPDPEERRNFWESNGANRKDLKRVVFVERAIDALSYHQIEPNEHTHYVSTGGGPLTPQQKQTLRDDFGDKKDLAIVAAFSSSKMGAQLTRELEECLDRKCERNAPNQGRKTWNDALQLKEKNYLLSQGVKVKGKGRQIEI